MHMLRLRLGGRNIGADHTFVLTREMVDASSVILKDSTHVLVTWKILARGLSGVRSLVFNDILFMYKIQKVHAHILIDFGLVEDGFLLLIAEKLRLA